MATMPVARTNSRAAAIALLLVALTGCGDRTRGARGMTVDLPQAELRKVIEGLAYCPSPLDRLRIERPPLDVASAGNDKLTIAIPGSPNTGTSLLAFTIDDLDDKPGGKVRVEWTFTPASGITEFDLGEGRLLNPAKLTEEMDNVVADFLDAGARTQATGAERRRLSRQLGEKCRKFGRIADSFAVMANPDLQAELTRQKRREALLWLFRDNYKLKTEGSPDSDWDAPREFSGPYEY